MRCVFVRVLLLFCNTPGRMGISLITLCINKYDIK